MAVGIEHEAFDFISRCWDHSAPAELLDDLLRTVRPLGFDYLIMSGVPVGGQNLAPLVELNGWPQGWLDRYLERGHAVVDGVCLYSAQTTRPFFWNDMPLPFASSKGTAIVAGEASEFGIRSGYAVPAHSPLHWHSVVSLASGAADCSMSKRQEMAVALMAVAAVGAVEALYRPVKPNLVLSDREREVALWLAAGKTKWEISSILSISEHTVDKHVRSILAKLNASNTAQAVAEAIRRREIVPAALSMA